MFSPAAKSSWFRRLLVILFASLLLTGILEWEHYRKLIALSASGAASIERLAVFWLLAAKTAWLLLPVWSASVLLERLGFARCGRVLWIAGCCTIVWSLVVDVLVQRMTGEHLHNYVPFLLSPATWAWGGGSQGLPLRFVIATLATIGGVLALEWLTGWLATRIKARPRASQLMVACSTGGLLIGIFPLLHALDGRPALERLRFSLPWNPVDLLSLDEGSSELGRFRTLLRDEIEVQAGASSNDLLHVHPIDTTPYQFPTPRHVVVLVLESLRHTVLDEGQLPQLAAWSRDGLRLRRHYAGSNASHWGVFALLYGRTPLLYHPTLQAGVPPQMCETLRRAGYECNYLSSGTIDWMGMNEFIRKPFFDRIEITEGENWPAGDEAVLRRVAELTRQERPQLIFAFLMSTHYPYKYPREYERRLPVVSESDVLFDARARQAEIKNRYANAAGFLDDKIAQMLHEMDPRKCLVAVTGDHGEALFDDGCLSHWGALSEVQTRVPFVLVGEGVPSQTIVTATTHADLLPTVLHALAGRPVEVAHTHGRDLLSPAPADEALLCTMSPELAIVGSQTWDVAYVRGNRRLGLQVTISPPRVRALGMFDDLGRVNSQHDLTQECPREWATALQAELGRLTR